MLERKFKQEGRYPGREEEVAARIVNQQRAAKGETKSASYRHTAPKRSASRRKSRAARHATRTER